VVTCKGKLRVKKSDLDINYRFGIQLSYNSLHTLVLARYLIISVTSTETDNNKSYINYEVDVLCFDNETYALQKQYLFASSTISWHVVLLKRLCLQILSQVRAGNRT